MRDSFKLATIRFITMRLLTVLAITFVAIQINAAKAASLSKTEKSAYTCVLKKARTESGTPEVAAYSAADACPMRGLTAAQKERVISRTIRQLMKEYGLSCIGTGCG